MTSSARLAISRGDKEGGATLPAEVIPRQRRVPSNIRFHCTFLLWFCVGYTAQACESEEQDGGMSDRRVHLEDLIVTIAHHVHVHEQIEIGDSRKSRLVA